MSDREINYLQKKVNDIEFEIANLQRDRDIILKIMKRLE